MAIENRPRTAKQSARLPEPILDVVLDLWAQAGSKHEIPVSGNSMWPMLREGDQIRLLHGAADLRCGDIVAYQDKERLIIHRLIRRIEASGKTLYLMKGDNAAAMDPAVPARIILGRAVALRRTAKWRRVDTPLCRAVGWVIATTTLARRALSRRVKRVMDLDQ